MTSRRSTPSASPCPRVGDRPLGSERRRQDTILRCLLGLARFTGEVRVAGHDPLRDGRAVRQAIGYVPQDLPVSPMTVGEFTAFIARLKRAPLARALERLDLLGIGDQTEKRVGDLSGGMKQRLALALALIGTPQILLLDEPTANLDAHGRAELLDLLRGLRRDGLTLVFSSHLPEDVMALADRVLMVEAGVLRKKSPGRLPAGTRRHLAPDGVPQERASPEALATIDRLGFAATGERHVVSVPLPLREGRVLGRSSRAGIDIVDFDVERI